MNVAVLMLAAALSAGNAEFDRTAAEGAARIAVGRFRAELVRMGPGDGFLKEAMLTDPSSHVIRAESEKRCRELHDVLVERRFADACADVRRRLALPDDFAFVLTSEDKAKAAERFASVFAAERQQAVSEQAKGIVKEIRPDEAAFEAHPEDRIRAVMTQLVVEGQDQPVFEENRQYISEQIVEPMIAGAKAARRNQKEYLMRARCDAVAPSRLTEELKARLEEHVAARKAKEKDAFRIWGVFPSVVNDELPAAVERRTLDRLVSTIETRSLEVSVEQVAAVIAQDPEAHVRTCDSEHAFASAYSHQVMDGSLEATVSEAPEAERPELKEYLFERRGAEPVAQAVERTIRRDVMPKWKAAREAVAAKQAERLWPSLTDGTWFPSAGLADATAARSDYLEAVRNWRTLSDLKDLAKAGAGHPVLEEASVRADAGVMQAFDRARSAIAAQNGIVDGQHPRVLDAFKAEGSRPSLKRVTESLTRATEERWAEVRLETLWPDGLRPRNAEDQHRELFPSVRKKIELLAKSILEELNQPQPDEKKPPEEPPPEEQPPEEEPPEEKLEFSISVVREGDSVEVKLLQGEAAVYEKRLDSRFAPFGAAMKEVSEKLGKDLLKLR